MKTATALALLLLLAALPAHAAWTGTYSLGAHGQMTCSASEPASVTIMLSEEARRLLGCSNTVIGFDIPPGIGIGEYPHDSTNPTGFTLDLDENLNQCTIGYGTTSLVSFPQ